MMMCFNIPFFMLHSVDFTNCSLLTDFTKDFDDDDNDNDAVVRSV